MFIILACLLVQAISVTATATATPAKHARSTHRSVATGARLVPPALKATAARKRQADRNLVARAKGVKRCLRTNPRHPNRCRSARRALQRAGVRLTRIERRLAKVAGAGSGTASAAASRSGRHGYNYGLRAARVAPTLTVSGQKLSWNRVDNINNYVLLIRVPNEAVQYSVVTGTSMTPPPVPGETVSYSVRTSTEGSSWSAEKSITYAAAKEIEKLKAPEEIKITEKPTEKKAPEEVKAPEKVNTQAAPELVVSGEKLVWNSIAGVTTYVLVTKVPGKTEQFTEVSGTSITPAAVPGVTVHYSVRTAVEGSVLSPEVAITYPAATPPKTEGSGGGGSTGSGQQQFIDGINDPLYNETTTKELVGAGITGARTGGTSQLAGIKSAGYVMADTDDIVGDTTDESPLSGVNISSWTSSTLKEVETASADGVVLMEVGNEMFLKDESAHEGQRYGEMYLSLYNAVQSSSVAGKVKLLANSYGASWLADMLKASSSLKTDVQGFTMHPYGLPHENNSGNWGPGALEAEHAEAVSLGFAHTEYWATEYGVELGGSGANGASTEAIKAEHIEQVYKELIATGYVAGIYYYQVGDDGTGGNGKWGLVEPSGAERAKPFDAVASFKDIFIPAE